MQLLELTICSLDVLSQVLEHNNFREFKSKVKDVCFISELSLNLFQDINLKLCDEFITPIEREDIFNVGQGIYDTTKSLEASIKLIALYQLKCVPSQLFVHNKLVLDFCSNLLDFLPKFINFKKPGLLLEHIFTLDIILIQVCQNIDDFQVDSYTHTNNTREFIVCSNLSHVCTCTCLNLNTLLQKLKLLVLRNS